MLGCHDGIIVLLRRRKTRALVLALPCEKTRVCKRRGLSAENAFVYTLILDLPASRNVRNKYVLLKPPTL